MSATAVSDLVDRTMTDEAFLDRVRTDPDAALAEYDLESDELAALESRREDRVRDALGQAELGWDVSIVVVVAG
ncbi:MAG: Os1348 family NHLP clan protein [Halobacteriales archaeon]